MKIETINKLLISKMDKMNQNNKCKNMIKIVVKKNSPPGVVENNVPPGVDE